MKIPAFVNLKNHMDADERQALVLLLEAAMQKTTAQVKTFDGKVVEGYLNIVFPPKIQTFFGALLNRVK